MLYLVELTNNLVSNEIEVPSIVPYKPNDYWITKQQRKCCRRGRKAARKGMNCNRSDLMQSIQSLRRLKLNVQLHKEDASFAHKVRKCFLKPDAEQYFIRCCKDSRIVAKH